MNRSSINLYQAKIIHAGPHLMHLIKYTHAGCNKRKESLNKQPTGCDAQTAGHAYKKMIYKPSKLGQIEEFLVCHQSSLVGLCLQDKSLHVAFTVYAKMVNTQTHRQTDSF